MKILDSDTHFDFMGKIKMAMIISGLMILIGLGSIVFSGGLKYGIDFAGGTLIQLQFKTPPDIEVIRDGLKTIALGESTIQEFGSKKDILIRVQRSEEKLESVGLGKVPCRRPATYFGRRNVSTETDPKDVTLALEKVRGWVR